PPELYTDLPHDPIRWHDTGNAKLARERLPAQGSTQEVRTTRRPPSAEPLWGQSSRTSGTSTRCSERNQTCNSFVRITSLTSRSFVPSSPISAACRAIVLASNNM